LLAVAVTLRSITGAMLRTKDKRAIDGPGDPGFQAQLVGTGHPPEPLGTGESKLVLPVSGTLAPQIPSMSLSLVHPPQAAPQPAASSTDVSEVSSATATEENEIKIEEEKEIERRAAAAEELILGRAKAAAVPEPDATVDLEVQEPPLPPPVAQEPAPAPTLPKQEDPLLAGSTVEAAQEATPEDLAAPGADDVQAPPTPPGVSGEQSSSDITEPGPPASLPPASSEPGPAPEADPVAPPAPPNTEEVLPAAAEVAAELSTEPAHTSSSHGVDGNSESEREAGLKAAQDLFDYARNAAEKAAEATVEAKVAEKMKELEEKHLANQEMAIQEAVGAVEDEMTDKLKQSEKDAAAEVKAAVGEMQADAADAVADAKADAAADAAAAKSELNTALDEAEAKAEAEAAAAMKKAVANALDESEAQTEDAVAAAKAKAKAALSAEGKEAAEAVAAAKKKCAEMGHKVEVVGNGKGACKAGVFEPLGWYATYSEAQALLIETCQSGSAPHDPAVCAAGAAEMFSGQDMAAGTFVQDMNAHEDGPFCKMVRHVLKAHDAWKAARKAMHLRSSAGALHNPATVDESVLPKGSKPEGHRADPLMSAEDAAKANADHAHDVASAAHSAAAAKAAADATAADSMATEAEKAAARAAADKAAADAAASAAAMKKTKLEGAVKEAEEAAAKAAAQKALCEKNAADAKAAADAVGARVDDAKVAADLAAEKAQKEAKQAAALKAEGDAAAAAAANAGDDADEAAKKAAELRLEVGDRVEISTGFQYKSSGAVPLTHGMSGTVAKLDDVGDALINFDNVGMQWVLKRDFDKLKKAASELQPEGH